MPTLMMGTVLLKDEELARDLRYGEQRLLLTLLLPWFWLIIDNYETAVVARTCSTTKMRKWASCLCKTGMKWRRRMRRWASRSRNGMMTARCVFASQTGGRHSPPSRMPRPMRSITPAQPSASSSVSTGRRPSEQQTTDCCSRHFTHATPPRGISSGPVCLSVRHKSEFIETAERIEYTFGTEHSTCPTLCWKVIRISIS